MEQMYSRSSIYKLQCDDGYFYIGSTCNDLRVRFANHKRDGLKNPTQPVYNHIAGKWDNVRIILITTVNCNNKDELRRVENDYIQQNLNNPLCLNVNKAWTGIPRDENYYQNWLKQNPNYFKNWVKDHPNYMKQWREKNPDKVKQYNQKHRVKKSVDNNTNAVPDKEGLAQGTQSPNPFAAFGNSGSTHEGSVRTEKGSESISAKEVNALPHNLVPQSHPETLCCRNH
jgi:hypothetical protein